MANSRIPGPVGTNTNFPSVDAGTSVRSATPLSSVIGITPAGSALASAVGNNKLGVYEATTFLDFSADQVGGTEAASIWDEIRRTLIYLYSLPHNRFDSKGPKKTTPQQEAKEKIEEIKSGIASLMREDFHGPGLFLRVTGPKNRAYSGEWWFDARIFDTLDLAYSRIYFHETDKKRVLRDMLREILAISVKWNEITEVWALELPPDETLRGYSGPGTPQKLFHDLPLTSEGNRMLVGKVRQIFFPVKNPLWVKHYQNLGF
jgi:hypothetical protein